MIIIRMVIRNSHIKVLQITKYWLYRNSYVKLSGYDSYLSKIRYANFVITKVSPLRILGDNGKIIH